MISIYIYSHFTSTAQHLHQSKQNTADTTEQKQHTAEAKTNSHGSKTNKHMLHKKKKKKKLKSPKYISQNTITNQNTTKAWVSYPICSKSKPSPSEKVPAKRASKTVTRNQQQHTTAENNHPLQGTNSIHKTYTGIHNLLTIMNTTKYII